MTVSLVVLWLLAQGASPPQLHGVVLDASGAPIAGALVDVAGRTATTDARGAFSLPVAEGVAELRVRAAGFAEYAGRVRQDGPARIVLHPSGVAETVTVTANRSIERIADAATATSVIAAPALLTSANMTVDDALRTIPGFSLFRRSSSRVANPTTQGATLRGLSASGASRALVLADGIPLNDAYGGWVYWDRVPLAAIDRVEVVRGGGTEALYGNQSIGGTLQIAAVEPAPPTARVSLEVGQHDERRASLYAGTRHGEWNGFLAAERFVLGGFPIVAPEERGPVDVNAGMNCWSALGDAGWSGSRWGVGIRANWLDEDRANGTPLQRNDTRLWTLAVRGRALTRAGAMAYTAYGGSATYHQSFSAVNASRTVEILTSVQHVSSDHAGGSVQWFGAWGRHLLMAGADARHVSGGDAPAERGIQNDYAAFAQVQAHLTETTTVTAGLRAGGWSTTLENSVGFDRTEIYFLPRVSVVWTAVPALSLTASWSNPGRTPSLNELYRDFRVGNTLTFANPDLRPEDAQSIEVGALWRHGSGSGRVVAYWTSLDRAITNVTLRSTGSVILRQRRNAGQIRARGLEAEGEWRVRAWATIAGAIVWPDSRFTSSDEPGLAGKRVAQVPEVQGALSLRLTPGRAAVTADWRGMGLQFDDDRNVFELRAAQVVDLYAGASLARGLQPFLAIENLLDAEVDVGRTPVRTIGTPRSLRAGVRLFLR